MRRIEDELSDLVQSEIEQAGYIVSTTEEKTARVALGGLLKSYACTSAREKSCGLTIEWALFDIESGLPVYGVQTNHEETELSTVPRSEAARTLVRGATRSLLSRAKFQRAVSSPPDVYQDRLEPVALRRCLESKLEMPKDAERVLSATAVVRTKGGVGSAVAISPDGYLLTAAHVVSGFEKKGVTVIPRGGKERKASIVRYDPASDVALLRVEGRVESGVCLSLFEGEAKAGQDVYVVGAPAGEELSFSMSRGILSGMRHLHGNRYLQTDASINPGNSGGPLLDGSAEVLGIVSWKLSGRALEGLGFAVEIDSVLDALSLRLDKATSSELASEVGRTNVRKKPVIDRRDDAFRVVGVERDAERSRGGDAELVGILRGAGLLALVVGGGMILGSALAGSGSSPGSGDYYTAQSWFHAGWVVGGVGAAAVVTSFVIPLFGRRDATAAAGVLSSGGVGLTCRLAY